MRSLRCGGKEAASNSARLEEEDIGHGAYGEHRACSDF
jgi:hypothetical protein